MDNRDIVAATLAGAVLQTLIGTAGGGGGGTVAETRANQDETIQLAISLYQRVLAQLPPERP